LRKAASTLSSIWARSRYSKRGAHSWRGDTSKVPDLNWVSHENISAGKEKKSLFSLSQMEAHATASPRFCDSPSAGLKCYVPLKLWLAVRDRHPRDNPACSGNGRIPGSGIFTDWQRSGPDHCLLRSGLCGCRWILGLTRQKKKNPQ